MENLLAWIKDGVGPVVGVIIGMFTVSKMQTKPLARRIDRLENAPSPRSTVECEKMMASCPVLIRVSHIEKDNEGFQAWLIRIEGKLDRAIEKGN